MEMGNPHIQNATSRRKKSVSVNMGVSNIMEEINFQARVAAQPDRRANAYCRINDYVGEYAGYHSD